jgi:hypothetical protein
MGLKYPFRIPFAILFVFVRQFRRWFDDCEWGSVKDFLT